MGLNGFVCLSGTDESLYEFRMVLVASQRHVFYNRIHEKQFFTLPVVNDNEIVRSTSEGVEGKTGLICLVRCI